VTPIQIKQEPSKKLKIDLKDGNDGKVKKNSTIGCLWRLCELAGVQRKSGVTYKCSRPDGEECTHAHNFNSVEESKTWIKEEHFKKWEAHETVKDAMIENGCIPKEWKE